MGYVRYRQGIWNTEIHDIAMGQKVYGPEHEIQGYNICDTKIQIQQNNTMVTETDNGVR